MDNFSIFDQALEQYTAEKAYDTPTPKKSDQCEHKNIRIESNIKTCEDCGKEITRELDFEKEWRYYGADDSQNKDPTRCGMPINPLLRESSFGCKVMTNSNINSILEDSLNYAVLVAPNWLISAFEKRLRKTERS